MKGQTMNKKNTRLTAFAAVALAFAAFGEPTCGIDGDGVYFVLQAQGSTTMKFTKAGLSTGGEFPSGGVR